MKVRQKRTTGAGPLAPYHDKDAWWAVRKTLLGSTDVAAILGVDPWKDGANVWDRIVLGDEDDAPEGGDIRRGNRQEANAADVFVEHFGVQIRRHPMQRHREHPFMVTDVDRLIVAPDPWPEALAQYMDPQPGPGALEIKVPRVARFYEYRDSGLPLPYILQLQHHFAVTGWQWGVFAFYTPEYDDLIAFPVVRDDDFLGAAMPRLVHWWKTYVVGRVRPERPAPAPPRWPAKVAGRATPHDGDFEWVTAAESYINAQADEERARMAREAAEAQLVALMGEEEQVGSGAGLIVKRYSTSSQHRFDTKAFLAALKLAQEEGDTEALRTIDPNDEAFYYDTQARDKVDVKIVAPADREEAVAS